MSLWPTGIAETTIVESSCFGWMTQPVRAESNAIAEVVDGNTPQSPYKNVDGQDSVSLFWAKS